MSFPTEVYVSSVRRIVETGRFESRILFYGNERFEGSDIFIPKGLVVLRDWEDSKDLTKTILEGFLFWSTLEASHAVISLDLWESESAEPTIFDEGLRRAVYVLFYPEAAAHRLYYSVDDRGRKICEPAQRITFLTWWWTLLDEMTDAQLPWAVPGFLRSRGHQLVDLRAERS